MKITGHKCAKETSIITSKVMSGVKKNYWNLTQLLRCVYHSVIISFKSNDSSYRSNDGPSKLKVLIFNSKLRVCVCLSKVK